MVDIASIHPVRTPRDSTLTMRGFPFGSGDVAEFRARHPISPNGRWNVLGLVDHDGLAAKDKRCVVISPEHAPDWFRVLSLKRFGGLLQAVARSFTAEYSPLRPGGPLGAVVKDARGRVFWKDDKGLCKTQSDLRGLGVTLQRAHVIDWKDDVLTGREVARRLAPVRSRADDVFAQLEQQMRDVRYYGEVTAPKGERDLIASFGARVGQYSHERGTFPIEIDANQMMDLRRVADAFPIRAESLSRFERHALPGEMNDPLLARYHNYLQVVAQFEVDGPRLERGSAQELLDEVSREVTKRSAVNRLDQDRAESPEPSL